MQQGYRVGGQCFATLEEASDYKLSMVVPTITADGSLKTVVYQNKNWYYGSQKIQLTFPECDQNQPFKEGVQFGAIILTLFVIAYVFRQVKKIFWHSIVEEGRRD